MDGIRGFLILFVVVVVFLVVFPINVPSVAFGFVLGVLATRAQQRRGL